MSAILIKGRQHTPKGNKLSGPLLPSSETGAKQNEKIRIILRIIGDSFTNAIIDRRWSRSKHTSMQCKIPAVHCAKQSQKRRSEN